MSHGVVRSKQRCAKAGKAASTRDFLDSVDWHALWNRLLKSENERIVLDTVKYLNELKEGKTHPSPEPEEVEMTTEQVRERLKELFSQR